MLSYIESNIGRGSTENDSGWNDGVEVDQLEYTYRYDNIWHSSIKNRCDPYIRKFGRIKIKKFGQVRNETTDAIVRTC